MGDSQDRVPAATVMLWFPFFGALWGAVAAVVVFVVITMSVSPGLLILVLPAALFGAALGIPGGLITGAGAALATRISRDDPVLRVSALVLTSVTGAALATVIALALVDALRQPFAALPLTVIPAGAAVFGPLSVYRLERRRPEPPVSGAWQFIGGVAAGSLALAVVVGAAGNPAGWVHALGAAIAAAGVVLLVVGMVRAARSQDFGPSGWLLPLLGTALVIGLVILFTVSTGSALHPPVAPPPLILG